MSNKMHPACFSDEKLLTECDVSRTRRGGPGGQHRNKVESAIVIEHLPTSVRGEASERRSQHENMAVALRRLRINLALAVRTADQLDERPSELWQSRCRGGRIEVSPNHADFPQLLAELLDVLALVAFDQRRAAEHFACSSSQLVKFLKLEPHAFEQTNRQRQQRGLASLK